MSCIAKIDPTCIINKESVDLLIQTLEKTNPDLIFVTISQNANKNLITILQAAKIKDTSCYTMLRNIVLEYKGIFNSISEINSIVEKFYHDAEALVKFVEISGEFTQNLVNIMREYFSRFTFTLLNKYTNGQMNFVQYYTKDADSTTPHTLKKVLLLKHRKHIYNIDKKYINSPQIVKEVSYQDILEAPALNFNGLTKTELLALKNKNAIIEVIEIDGNVLETTISTKQTDGNIKIATCVEDIAIITLTHTESDALLSNFSEVICFCYKGDIKIYITSQSSSQSSISFAVKKYHLEKVKSYIDARFNVDISKGLFSYHILDDQSIVSVIGNGIIGKTGTAGTLFSYLGSKGVNIHTIAQNASEVNISFSIESGKTDYVMNEINKMCFLKSNHVSLCIFGYGNVSKGLLKMINKQESYFKKQGVSLSINFIANSTKYIISPEAMDAQTTIENFESSAIKYQNIDELLHNITRFELPNPIFVDLTSSDELAERYIDFIKNGIHIVSASKKANSLPFEQYKEIHTNCAKYGVNFLYEANVGAGLPVVATVQDMLHTGDTIKKIEGIFSGTLSYIFNNYNGTKPFSEIVKEAREQGFTEPDPRDDLCGADAARKVLILARMAGLEMNYEDITIESLVPKELEGGSFDNSFFEKYHKQDTILGEMHKNATKEGKVLRYICLLENGKASAKVLAVPQNSPLGSVSETDNIIVFSTEYYNKTPIVIQGPGAGIEVTSMAVLSDIIKIFKYIQV
ncbi:MAG: aspartokinase/homoserine dehydrogenase 1 [Candidatus Deianiraeaceae bacterium]|jgi:aspartokinase/homoserine dehydrogenase 1